MIRIAFILESGYRAQRRSFPIFTKTLAEKAWPSYECASLFKKTRLEAAGFHFVDPLKPGGNFPHDFYAYGENQEKMQKSRDFSLTKQHLFLIIRVR